jgi:hypothetical protein
MAVTATGYAVQSLSNLLAIGSADRPASGSNLYYKLFVYEEGRDYYFNPDATSGGVAPNSGTGRWFPCTRIFLTTDLTLYVRTDGSDSNTGLANTSGAAFLTIQKALDVAASKYEVGGNIITVQVGNGTYSITTPLNLPNVRMPTSWKLIGDETTPANVVLSGNTGAGTGVLTAGTGTTTALGYSANWYVAGFTISNSTGSGMIANGGSTIWRGNLTFGTCAEYQTVAQNAGKISTTIYGTGTTTTITGGALAHSYTTGLGIISNYTNNCTITGTPAFGTAFALLTLGSHQQWFSSTFTGAATGKRYDVQTNSTVYTSGGGNTTFFPGSVAGTTATGGVYS